MENWKDIKGFEGLYQVSDLGRVKSLNYNKTGKERVLVGIKGKNGYLTVGLHKEGKRKICRVHRLVAEAFIPNPEGLPEVNHRDEDKKSNIVTNLEWCDRRYNVNYGTRNERSSKANTNSPSQSKEVYQYNLDGSLVRSYPSTAEAERRTGYSQGNISKCCNGKFKTMYGFIWSYTQFIPKGRLF